MAAERTIRKKGAKNREITESLKGVMKLIMANRKEQQIKENLQNSAPVSVPITQPVTEAVAQ
jgi:hypothetical protein